MTYQPRRTPRYAYAEDLITDIEERQCGSCQLRQPDEPERPMCFDASVPATLADPIAFWDGQPDGSVVCRRYKEGDVLAPVDPNQLGLFPTEGGATDE